MPDGVEVPPRLQVLVKAGNPSISRGTMVAVGTVLPTATHAQDGGVGEDDIHGARCSGVPARSSSSAVSTVPHIVPLTLRALLTSPVPPPNSCLPSLDKGTPGESRGRNATGPRRPPQRLTVYPPDATKDPTTAELSKGRRNC